MELLSGLWRRSAAGVRRTLLTLMLAQLLIAGVTRSQKIGSFAVPDATPQGSTIGIISAPPGYVFRPLLSQAFLTLSPTGVLTSSVALYRSVILDYPLSTIAQAASSTGAFIGYQIKVYIMVVEQSAPSFDPSLPLNYTIFAGRNESNAIVLWTSYSNASGLEYSIIGGNNDGLFALTTTIVRGRLAAMLTAVSPPPQSPGAYNLTVSAQVSNPVLRGYVTVTVQIANPSDYQPTLIGAAAAGYSASVQVNLPLKVPVLQLRAAVPDASSGQSRLWYAIANNSLFAVESSTGIVTVRANLSTTYMTERQYCNQSKCSGGGKCLTSCLVPVWATNTLIAAPNEQLSSSSMANINITAAPDVGPDFVDGFVATANVSEGAILGTSVMQFTINDVGDASVVAGDPTGAFTTECIVFTAITVCQIEVGGALDHQATPSYNLVVGIHAATKQFLYRSVVVSVTAVPLTWPAFVEDHYLVTVDSGDDQGTVVATVQAKGSQTGKVLYSIVSADPAGGYGQFTIQPYSGEVSLVSLASAAVTTTTPLLSILNISASDWKYPGLVAYTQAFIYLVPQRGALVCNLSLLSYGSSFAAAAAACGLRATGLYPALYWSSVPFWCGGVPPKNASAATACSLADLGGLQRKYSAAVGGAALTCSIASGYGSFEVTAQGLLTVARQLPTPGGKYRLTVLLSTTAGSGGANNRSTALVASTLALIRDPLEGPIAFDQPQGYAVTIYADEVTMLPAKVLKVTAYGQAAAVTYALVDSGSAAALFAVAPGSGDISVLVSGAQLASSNSTASVYQLTVVARSGTRLASVNVTVAALGSAGPPVFSDGAMAIAYVPEDAGLGEVVYVASASSRRGVTYSFWSSNSNTSKGGSLFSIDSATGLVRVASCPGGLVAMTSQSLTIAAMDRGPSGLTSFLLLNVTITDVNEHNPRFAQNKYTVYISESTSPGVGVLAQISATDADWGVNGQITYSLDPTAAGGGAFAILPGGYLTLVSSVDIERVPAYNLVVIATDGGVPARLATAAVGVWLTPVNENSPQFTASSYSFTVLENSPPGVILGQLTALDADSGRDGRVFYRAYGASSKNFYVDPTTGLISTSGFPLDREVLVAATGSATIVLTVVASDEGLPAPRTSAVNITVTVLDVNDNAPSFGVALLKVSVREDAALGSVAAVLNASDPDAGLNACVTYSLNGTSQFAFAISGSTLLVAGPLDRETHPYYVLTVIASDKGSPLSLSASALISIVVLGVDDSPPVFDPLPLPVSITEDSPPGSYVVRLRATDADLGSNAVVEYRIVGGSNGSSSAFAVDRYTGVLYTAAWLDFESQPAYSLLVSATNLAASTGTANSSSTVNVTVTVSNVNEAPQFARSSYLAYINESGQQATGSSGTNSSRPVIQVSAVDPDRSTSGTLLYSIVLALPADGVFGIDPASGWLYVKPGSSIDRERAASYLVTVAATEQAAGSSASPLTALTTVTVVVVDANDSPPVFASPPAATVAAGSPAVTLVMVVAASDADSGSNAQIRYSLAGASGACTVDAVSGGLVLSRALQSAVAVSNFSVVVQATDGGKPALSTQQVLDIIVLPNSGVGGSAASSTIGFDKATFAAAVPESSPVGTSILTVVLKSPPAVVPAFFLTSAVTASGSSAAANLAIDPSSGVLRVARSLACNVTCDTYNVTVCVVDLSGNAGNAGRVQVLVTVVADSPPAFDSVVYSATVREMGTVGEVLLSVRATDHSGSSDNMSYSASSNDTGCRFAVNSSSGAVSTAAQLNYSLTPVCVVQLSACNSAGCTESVLNVAVLDLPMFTSAEYYFVVPRNGSAGLPAGRIALANGAAATGSSGAAGVQEAAAVTYRLAGSWGVQLFRLDAITGVLRLQAPLNKGSTAKLFALDVVATIGGLWPANATATVYVSTSPDPESTDCSVVSLSLREDVVVGTSLGPPLSSRPYAELGSRYAYSIISGDWLAQFSISAVDGQITTAAPLDRETIAWYSLVVIATDPVDASVTASATVAVTILGVNEHAPIFTSPAVVGVVENSVPPQPVMTCSAYNVDTGGTVEYSLVSASSGGGSSFDVNRYTGVLTAIVSLDRESVPAYNVTIMARDLGSPPQSALMTVTVIVEDVNEHSPQFAHAQPTRISVPEDTPAGTTILTLSASDPDAGLNGTVRYYILSGVGSDDFTLDGISGALMVGPAGLNYQQRRDYTLLVLASDLGYPLSLQSPSLQLSVTVTYVWDGVVAFLDAPFYRRLTEDLPTPPAVCMGQLTAGQPLGNATFRLIPADSDLSSSAATAAALLTFAVDPRSGSLVATRTVDREAFQQLLLSAALVGVDNVSSLATAALTVTITHVNDKPPTFELPFYAVSVAEGRPAGTAVLTVAATDPDPVGNPNITYSLVKGYGLFAIDYLTGAVSLLAPLDSEAEDFFLLYAVASDNGAPPLNTSVPISVYVDNINDNAPTFTQSAYSVSTPVAITQGTFLLGVTAVDPDLGAYGAVTYTILSAPANSILQINSTTGVITAASDATMSPQATLSAVVRAQDAGGLFSDVAVNVTFSSAAVSSCTYVLRPQAVAVMETAPVGTALLTVSASSSAGLLTYWIAGGNLGDSFGVDTSTGVLTVKRALNYEAFPAYTLWIGMTVGNYSCMPTYLTCDVAVSSINNRGPRFSSYLVRATVLEQVAPSQLPPVALMNATDTEPGVNGTLQYRLNAKLSSVSSPPFRVDPTVGSVFVTAPLDREVVDSYMIVVEAYDIGPAPLTATALVLVTVADANDNAPVFAHGYSWAVPENAPAGTVVGKVAATDRDVGNSSFITYSLLDNREAFAVTQVGVVVTRYPLDREVTASYLLTIVASTSLASPVVSTVTKVNVTVLDVNDNAPVFQPTSYSFVMNKTDWALYNIGRVSATDADGPGPNSLVQYTLRAPSTLFTVNSSSGFIYAKQAITYTAGCVNRYMLYVIASDHGSPPLSSATATVTITLLSSVAASRISIQWSSSRGLWPFVPSNLPLNATALLLKPTVTGPAVIRLSQTTYGNGSATFSISSCGEVAVRQSLAGYIGATFQLTAWVVDQVTGEPLSNVLMTLSVTAPNVYTPAFSTVDSYNYTVHENASLGYVIATVQATDQDQGVNGQLKFFIVDGNDLGWFSIGEDDGMLHVSSTMDFTVRPSSLITVKAEDQGFFPKAAWQLISILISTALPHPSFPTKSYVAYVPDSSAVGTAVITVSALCRPWLPSPVLASIAYAIPGSADAIVFAMNPSTGLIRTAALLDYKVRSMYTITAVAYIPSPTTYNDSATIQIGVIGGNRYPPTFLQSFFYFPWPAATITDNSSIQVGAVVATDLDAGAGGVIEFFLLGDSNGNGFTIDPLSGALWWSLDGSAGAQTVLQLQHAVLTVLAKNVGPLYDAGHWSACTVEVGVPPQQAFAFTASMYNVSLADSSNVGTCALVVRVRGLAPVKDFQFVLVGPSGSADDAAYFAVDPRSGVFTTTTNLPVAAARSKYLLIVKAVDADATQRTLATATVAVYAFTPNTAAAYFVPTTQPHVSVLESLPASSFVVNLAPLTRANGVAPTTASTSSFRYSVADPAFVVDPQTGILVTTGPLSSSAKQSDLLVTVDVACAQAALCAPAQLSVRVTVLAAGVPPANADLAVTVPYRGSLSAMTPVDVVDFSSLEPWYSLGSNRVHCVLMTRSSDSALALLGTTCRLQLIASPGGGGAAAVTSATVSVKRLVDLATTAFAVAVTAVPYTDDAQLARSSVVLFEGLQPAQLVELWLPAYLAQVAAALPPSPGAMAAAPPVVSSVVPSAAEGSVAVLTTATTGAVVGAATLASAADAACSVLRRAANVTCSTQSAPCSVASCPGSTGACVDSYSTAPLLQTIGGWPNALVAPATATVRAACTCTAGTSSGNCTAPVPSCKVSPCRNGGSCRLPAVGPGAPLSFTCDCPPDYFGQYCENSPQGFSDSSYAVFRGLSAGNSSSIELTFATYSSRALLAYRADDISSGSGSNVTGRALALQILAGLLTVRFTVDGGAVSSLTVNRTVSTGSWFRVVARRTAGVGSSLQVAPCVGPTNCSDCSPSDSACAAAALADGGSGAARVWPGAVSRSSTLSVGGLASLVPGGTPAGILGAVTYLGCIASLRVDDADLSFGDASLTSSLTAGCGNEGRCGASDCSSGGGGSGVCTAGVGGATCSCMGGNYAADSCASVPGVPASLAESASVSYRRTAAYQRLAALSLAPAASTRRKRRSLPTSGRVVSLALRTARSDGGLLLVNCSSGLLSLQISDGQAVLSLDGQLQLVNGRVLLNDSAWHVLDVTLYPSSIDISVDGSSPVERAATTSGYYAKFDPLGADVQEIVLAPQQQQSGAPGFVGCLQNFTINGTFMPVANASTDQFVATLTGGVSYSCSICDSCTTSGACSASGSSAGCATMRSSEPLPLTTLTQWKLIVIIVVSIIVAFGLVLGITLAYFRCKKSRQLQKKAAFAARPPSVHVASARPATSSFDNGAFDSMNSTRPLSHIDENDFANPLAARSHRSNRTPALTTRTVPSPVYDQQEDIVIIENSVDSGGERREFYDLDVASIAPSDIDDMAGYYKGYRSSARGGKSYAERGSPADVASASRARPKSAAPLGAQTHAGMRAAQYQRSATPGGLHERKTRSPLTLGNDQQLRVQLGTPDRLLLPPLSSNRRTPVDELQLRAAMRRTPVDEPLPRASARRTPVDELQRRVAEVSGRRSRGYRQGSDSSDPTYGDSPAVGHSRPGSRPAQPRTESRMGVHMQHNLNRLSNQSLTSESETDDTPPGDAGPLERRNICIDDSTSEDTSNDSFTASEFEAELEPKIRNDQYPGGMMFTKLQEVDDESDAADSIRVRSTFAWESIRGADGHQVLSRFLHQPSAVTKADYLTKGNKSDGNGSFRWDYFFSWGPSFEKLAGVFSDIAKLPSDDEILNMKTSTNVNSAPSRKEDYV